MAASFLDSDPIGWILVLKKLLNPKKDNFVIYIHTGILYTVLWKVFFAISYLIWIWSDCKDRVRIQIWT
jgi:hypothetical protein